MIDSHCINGLVSQRFPKGTELMTEGSKSGTLIFLTGGEVEICKGGIRMCKVKTKGAVFGEISALLDTPHTATVRTLTATTCLVAHDPALFFRQNPDAGYYIARLLAERLQDANLKFVALQQQVFNSPCLSPGSLKITAMLKPKRRPAQSKK